MGEARLGNMVKTHALERQEGKAKSRREGRRERIKEQRTFRKARVKVFVCVSPEPNLTSVDIFYFQLENDS